MNKTVTQIFKIGQLKHKDIMFVDVVPDADTKLFLDPTLISKVNSEIGIDANKLVKSFISCLLEAYRINDKNLLNQLLMHCHERNETHLGYGKYKSFGRGKSVTGVKDSLHSLADLFASGIVLRNANEIPIFIEGFAEDCMSDMLTNILSKLLNDFTLEIAEKYGLPVEDSQEIYYAWNYQLKKWMPWHDKHLVLPGTGRTIFLVPKWFVRTSYYVNVEQYFRSEVAAMVKISNTVTTRDGKDIIPTTKDISMRLKHEYGNLRKANMYYTRETPKLLEQYRDKIDKKTGLFMLDDVLDDAVLRAKVKE